MLSRHAPSRPPVIFVSHGAPDTLLKSPATLRGWAELGQSAGQPQAILMVSAHWETRTPMLSLAGAPATIHDFAGFDPRLSAMQYPAPGASALGERAAHLLDQAGLAVELHPRRGLDHGAWVPLMAMFPEANIPVTQLSVTRQTPAAHLALGQALAPLRDEGVLVVASGAITHNFGWIDWQAGEAASPLPQALDFTEWVAERLAGKDAESLCEYRDTPLGAAAHPTEEHLMPLFVALGAAGSSPAVRHRLPYAYRGLAMDAYHWV